MISLDKELNVFDSDGDHIGRIYQQTMTGAWYFRPRGNNALEYTDLEDIATVMKGRVIETTVSEGQTDD